MNDNKIADVFEEMIAAFPEGQQADLREALADITAPTFDTDQTAFDTHCRLHQVAVEANLTDLAVVHAKHIADISQRAGMWECLQQDAQRLYARALSENGQHAKSSEVYSALAASFLDPDAEDTVKLTDVLLDFAFEQAAVDDFPSAIQTVKKAIAIFGYNAPCEQAVYVIDMLIELASLCNAANQSDQALTHLEAHMQLVQRCCASPDLIAKAEDRLAKQKAGQAWLGYRTLPD